MSKYNLSHVNGGSGNVTERTEEHAFISLIYLVSVVFHLGPCHREVCLPVCVSLCVVKFRGLLINTHSATKMLLYLTRLRQSGLLCV